MMKHFLSLLLVVLVPVAGWGTNILISVAPDGTVVPSSVNGHALSLSGGSSVPTAAHAGVAKEIWITDRSVGHGGDGLAGAGTLLDPFDGSGTNFDTKMAALATAGTTNITIHLGVGTFTTNVATGTSGCAFFVKTGWHIIGAGNCVTIVQMTGNMAGKHYDVYAFKSDSSASTDNVVISDLMIDANASAISATADTVNGEKFYKSGGIFIWGSNNTVENVRVINAYGSLANSTERFGIGLNGPTASNGSNNWIKRCEVSSPSGTYGAPFAIFGTTGHPLSDSGVVDCLAFGINNGLNGGFNTGGVNFAFVKGIKIDRNTFVDCYGWAYIDTGTLDGLELTNNTCVRGWAGVLIQPASATPSNITISGNTGLFQNRDPASRVYGIRVSPVVTSATKVLIENNKIRYVNDGDVSATDEFASINVANGVGVRIINNTSDAASDAALAGTTSSTGVQILGNRSFAGAALSGLPDSASDPDITLASTADGDLYHQILITDTAAYSAAPKAGIAFAGKYNNAGDIGGMGGIMLHKTNATDGNTSSTLTLHTRANGAGVTARVWLYPAGGLSIGQDIDPGAFNLLQPASAYHNFGTTAGSSGYGMRDNSGTIEFKNSGGSWSAPQPLDSDLTTWGATTPPSSYAIGDILYASAANTLSKLADVATGNVLLSGGLTTAPAYGKVGLTTHVSGVLPVANGGTNATSASITAFNNITGLSAAGTTGTTSTNLVFSTSPTLVTPALGAATATSVAIGAGSAITSSGAGGTLGTGAFAAAGVTVTSPLSGTTALSLLTNVDFAFTLAQSITLAPAANTAGTGLLLTDTTAASSGNQQYSPAVRWTGQGWKTTATAASQAVDFRAYAKPVQGTTAPTAKWTLESSINGGGFTEVLNIQDTGQINLPVSGAYINTSGTFAPGGDSGNCAYAVSGVFIGSSRMVKFASNTTWSDTPDAGLGRNGVNILEVNTGTAISGTSNAASIKALTFIPAGTATTCTGATIGSGSKSNAGFVTATTSGTSTVVVTFPVTAPTGWTIMATDITSGVNMAQSAKSTTTATFTGATTSGDIVQYMAMAY